MTLFQQESKYLMNTYATLPIEIAYGQGSYLFDKNNKKYIDFTWHIKYSEERELLQSKFVLNHFLEKTCVTNPKIIFTGGCYGAGKGHTMRYLHNIGKINLDNYVCADPDKIRILFPEYDLLINTNKDNMGIITNKEAGYIVELIEYYALENNYNIIIDGSLKDHEWYIQHFQMIKKNFPQFEIIIIFVMSDLETILNRNCFRCESTQRCIPLQLITDTFDKIDDAYQNYLGIIQKCYKIRNYKDDTDPDFILDTNNVII